MFMKEDEATVVIKGKHGMTHFPLWLIGSF